jgi:transposase, IS6 family
MIRSAIAEKLKRGSKDDFKVRHFEAPLILQAISWYLVLNRVQFETRS